MNASSESRNYWWWMYQMRVVILDGECIKWESYFLVMNVSSKSRNSWWWMYQVTVVILDECITKGHTNSFWARKCNPFSIAHFSILFRHRCNWLLLIFVLVPRYKEVINIKRMLSFKSWARLFILILRNVTEMMLPWELPSLIHESQNNWIYYDVKLSFR